MPPRTLLSRVWRDCPEDLPCVEIVERATCDIAQAQAERQRQEHAQQKQRLQDWKHSVSSTSGLCRWLRCKSEVQGSAHVCLDGQVAADHVDAAKHIFGFWQNFWVQHPNRNLDHGAIGQQLAQQILANRPPGKLLFNLGRRPFKI